MAKQQINFRATAQRMVRQGFAGILAEAAQKQRDYDIEFLREHGLKHAADLLQRLPLKPAAEPADDDQHQLERMDTDADHIHPDAGIPIELPNKDGDPESVPA